MHFSIPDTQDFKDEAGTTYTVILSLVVMSFRKDYIFPVAGLTLAQNLLKPTH